MSPFEYIVNGIKTISSNKMRSWLTMLWIIIWVSSVIIMLAIWKWAQESVTQRIQQMWSNLLIIMPWNPSTTNARNIFWRWTPNSFLSADDIEILKKDIDWILALSPEYSWRKQAIYKNNNMQVSIIWVVPEYEKVRNFKVAYWQFITEENQKYISRVAVIWKWVASNLFQWLNPIWEDLRIENNIFTIVWIMEEKWSDNQDNAIIIPLSTVQKRIFWKNSVSSIYVAVKDANNINNIKNDIEKTLLKSHKIINPEEADFTVINQLEIIATMESVTQVFTLLLWWIATVSLIVWWIWVMNIMLVSVTERTKEIWIRKAIWARNKDILYQFLTESILLSIIWWIIWIIFSQIIILILKKYLTTFTLSFSLSPIILSFIFSVSVWIIFWITPAIKASKLNPIEALRYE